MILQDGNNVACDIIESDILNINNLFLFINFPLYCYLSEIKPENLPINDLLN